MKTILIISGVFLVVLVIMIIILRILTSKLKKLKLDLSKTTSELEKTTQELSNTKVHLAISVQEYQNLLAKSAQSKKDLLSNSSSDLSPEEQLALAHEVLK